VLNGGGGLNDFSAEVDWIVKHNVQISSTIQVERWNFPLLSSAPVYNVSTGLQLSFLPPGGWSLRQLR